MNKLRLIRIFELRGKVHPIEQYVIDILDGIFKNNKGKHIVVYGKEGIEYFAYILNTNRIYLKIIVYNDFNTKFGCSYEEARVILKYLLEKHLKLEINEVLCIY